MWGVAKPINRCKERYGFYKEPEALSSSDWVECVERLRYPPLSTVVHSTPEAMANKVNLTNGNGTVPDKHRTCYHSNDPRVNTALADRLRGKNLLIAGGSRGIGLVTAQFFAYCSPASVSICADASTEELEEAAQSCVKIASSLRIKVRRLDVCDASAVAQFVSEVETDFGGVDVCIMNAGHPPQWLPLSSGSPDLWWRSVEIGIRGSYNFARFVLPGMIRRKSGCIILTASAGAHGNAGYSAYTTAKLAMVRLAEIIHAENHKEHGITAFAISPGAVPTRMFTDFREANEGRFLEDSYVKRGVEGEEESVRIAMDHFSMIKKWDEPEMAAGMSVMLAGGQLDFLSGRYVDCSTSVEKWLREKDEIVSKDLYRVRLNAGNAGMIPVLDH